MAPFLSARTDRYLWKYWHESARVVILFFYTKVIQV